MGPKSCKGQKPKAHNKEKEEEDMKSINRATTMKNTMKKLFPSGKYFYNKESGQG